MLTIRKNSVSADVGPARQLLTGRQSRVSRRPGALRSLRPRAAVPAAARREFAAAAPVLIGAWALAGFYLGLSAEVLQDIFKIDSGLTDGAAVTIATGAGALTVYASKRVAPRVTAIIGTAALTLGMLATLTAVAAAAVGLGTHLVRRVGGRRSEPAGSRALEPL
jgi:hypothetical protein